MLVRRWRFLSARSLQAYREASSSSGGGSKLVQAAIAGLDRAIQSRGKKSTNWAKDPIRPEIQDAEAIVRGVKSGRIDKSLVPHLRDSTRIACLVLSHLSLPDHAVSFFVWAAKQDGFKHDIASANQLLETLVRSGRGVDAYAIFKQRFAQMFRADAFTYTVLVRGLSEAGRVDEACELFNDMHGHGNVKMKAGVYTALLNGLLRAGKLDDAFSYFQMMQESVTPPDSATYSTMIYELSRQGSLDHAARVVQGMIDREATPDMASLNVSLELLCRKGRAIDAWKLLGLMREKQYKPDSVAFTYVIRKLVEGGELDRAIEGFDEISRSEKLQPDFITYCVVVDGLCSAGRFRDAIKMLERMIAEKKMPDAATFRSLVESHSKPRMVEDRGKTKAIDDGKRAKPTATMYTLLMYGLFRTGRIAEAEELYGQVLSSGSSSPSWLTVWVVIDGLGRRGRVAESEVVFSDSIRRGVAPETIVYNALISGLCRIGSLERALEMLKEMPEKKCLPDAETYGLLLDAICKAGRADDAEALLGEAVDGGLELDPEVHASVASLLRRTGRAEMNPKPEARRAVR